MDPGESRRRISHGVARQGYRLSRNLLKVAVVVMMMVVVVVVVVVGMIKVMVAMMVVVVVVGMIMMMVAMMVMVVVVVGKDAAMVVLTMSQPGCWGGRERRRRR